MTPRITVSVPASAPGTIIVQGLDGVDIAEAARWSWEWTLGDKVRRGFNAGAIVQNPGGHEVFLRVMRGNDLLATKVVATVPKLERRKLFVSREQRASDSNDGLGMATPLATITEALKRARDHHKIVLHCGNKWDVPSGLLITQDDLLFGAYGPGARPVLRWVGNGKDKAILGIASGCSDVLIQDIVFTNDDQNTTDETCASAIAAAGTRIGIRRCEFWNVAYAIKANNPGGLRGLVIEDCTAPLAFPVKRDGGTGVHAYFLYGSEVSDAAVYGCAVANTGVHAVRTNLCKRLAFDGNHLNVSNPFATLRLQVGEAYYVARNTLGGGGKNPNGVLEFGPLGQADGMKPPLDAKDAQGVPLYQRLRTTGFVAEENTLRETRIQVQHRTAHGTIRSNRIERAADAIMVSGWNTTYGAGVEDVEIRNNTVTGHLLRIEHPCQADGSAQLDVRGNRYGGELFQPGSLGAGAGTVRTMEGNVKA